MGEFEREVEAARQDREPLRPVFTSPKSIAFGKPNGRISDCQPHNLSRVMLGGLGYRFDKQSPIMNLWVDPVPEQKRINHHMHIRVAKREQPTTGRQNEQTFNDFKKRNSTQT